ncbi:MAG: hypothetical protein GF329_09875 [Candidatus Lokiarchaeota archaeon]|nr:hypothetical protein [Candidatus Lokiarchaeota archaeon]
MDENFEAIGSKLDGISQKIDKLYLSIKGLMVEFGKVNEAITDHLSKISNQITTYYQNLTDISTDDFERAKKMLSEIQNDLDAQLNLPNRNLIDLNEKLEMVLHLISKIVDPDELENQLLKIEGYIANLKE